MLRVEEIAGRTYQERMGDTLTALPLISGEWTNYNASDPGITILENLKKITKEAIINAYSEIKKSSRKIVSASVSPMPGIRNKSLVFSENKCFIPPEYEIIRFDITLPMPGTAQSARQSRKSGISWSISCFSF